MATPKHAMQPVYLDENGVARFRTNPIVEYLLDHGGIDLNQIAVWAHNQGDAVTHEDQAHFAQLIGYSVYGWADLHYVSSQEYSKAHARVKRLLALRASREVESQS